jgi:hypothetical protein
MLQAAQHLFIKIFDCSLVLVPSPVSITSINGPVYYSGVLKDSRLLVYILARYSGNILSSNVSLTETTIKNTFQGSIQLSAPLSPTDAK